MKSETVKKVGLIAGGAIVAVVGAPLALGAAGFTSAGIAAGSIAANMMSAAAIANGGGVAAGSVVAVLQSAGAAGLSATATTAVAGTGGALGWLTSLFLGKAKAKADDDDPADDDSPDDDPPAEPMLTVSDVVLK
ncbi:uncharacterized protein [Pagrus major]|uniref:uncharacterized protein isoform X2 n=1 Tax=Pagrus major TaxID=143350 RepID=UPI003CC8A154